MADYSDAQFFSDLSADHWGAVGRQMLRRDGARGMPAMLCWEYNGGFCHKTIVQARERGEIKTAVVRGPSELILLARLPPPQRVVKFNLHSVRK